MNSLQQITTKQKEEEKNYLFKRLARGLENPSYALKLKRKEGITTTRYNKTKQYHKHTKSIQDKENKHRLLTYAKEERRKTIYTLRHTTKHHKHTKSIHGETTSITLLTRTS